MVLGIECDALGEQIDRLVVVFGSKGLVAEIFECVGLYYR